MPAPRKLTRLMLNATLCVLSFGFGVHAQKDVPIGREALDEPQSIPRAAELRTAGMREYNLGHFAAATTLLDQAMALALEQSDQYVVALIHDDVGSIYQKQFEFAKADREFMKAADILRGQPGDSVALAMTLASWGESLSGEDSYDELRTV